MARETVTYEETFKKPGMEIRQEFLPSFPHLIDGIEIVDAFIVKAGRVDRKGKDLEFLEVRVYLNTPKKDELKEDG